MTVTDASNSTCSNIYTHPLWGEFPVDWTWFKCLETGKCIHIDSRCDLHPNPECIYEKNGIMVAEDEEGCLDEYKRKGLVARSANLVCQSPVHNSLTPAIFSDVYNDGFDHPVAVIPSGTIVQIVSTRCDGFYECFNNEDEYKCGEGEIETITIGITDLKHFQHYI